MNNLVGVRPSLARACVGALIGSAVALSCAPGALADTTDSTNWAGYAVHGKGVTYRTVVGSWRQPSATCTRGVNTYSSYWVGLGGYNQTSRALEQIGTEVDCTAGGQVRSTAWYELVPAGAVQLQLVVHPGDLMTAGVTVAGKTVSLLLYDATRKRGFLKTLSASQVDVTSAEWIVEAPSECVGASTCQTLLLADFGTAFFSRATAESTTGHAGGIADQTWQTTKIRLIPGGGRLFVKSGATPSIATATPSAISATGRSFNVSFSRISVSTTSPLLARQTSAPSAAELRHAAR